MASRIDTATSPQARTFGVTRRVVGPGSDTGPLDIARKRQLGNVEKYWQGTLPQIQPAPTIIDNVVLYAATFDVPNPADESMTQMTAQVFFATASAHDVVTAPVSALHKGHGHAGGRTNSWTPKQEQGSAAQIF